ncbi:hypothetical protein LZQ00_11645 [Sphingobacterium sp. SRCM116780]|uniref:hypothetical protein n=1 Tax=Sphingobacterium sp. SRCM116780 TaxID=2907623 RepID=UPI001F47ED87|nr:hypothetical protein [Sphingobacterium sp. SRCM116780]UIR54932.1 hypothetical protein LZQ00_11645 [Sphingobacterium sp. SRCM116780]
MKKILQYGLTILGVAAIVLWQTGYNPFASKTEAEVVSPNVFKEMKKQTESDGKRIALIGTFSVSNSDITINLGQPTSLMFEDENNNHIDFFKVWNGNGKNEFSLPTTFTPKDLKVYDNEGKEHRYNEKIKISFTLKRIKEAEPEKDPNTGEYAWEWEQLRIDPLK